MPTLTIPEEALLTDKEAKSLRDEIGTRLHFGKQYWWPLHARMDYWASMYFMLDAMCVDVHNTITNLDGFYCFLSQDVHLLPTKILPS